MNSIIVETAHEIIIIILTELIGHNAAIPGGALSHILLAPFQVRQVINFA